MGRPCNGGGRGISYRSIGEGQTRRVFFILKLNGWCFVGVGGAASSGV